MKGTLVAVLLLLIGFAWAMTSSRMAVADGHDFYHYWVMGNAGQLTSGKLDRLYGEHREFADAVNRHVEGIRDDGRLREANRRRRELDLTGTPLFYATFAVLPLEYETAFGWFQLVRVVAYLGTLLLLARLFSCDLLSMSVLAVTLWVAYVPLESDLQVGNVNVFQLALHALALVLACRVRGTATAAALLAVLAFLVFWKPTMVGFAVGLGVVAWARCGHRQTGMALVVGLASAVALFVLPALQFGSTAIWSDWYENLPAMYGRYTIEMGNFAVPQVADERFGIGAEVASVLMFVVLLASIVGCTWIAGRGRWWQLLELAAKDARLMGSAGIVATLACQPLVWEHYQVLSLLPALWLLWRPDPWRHDRWLAVLSILLSCGMPRWIGADRELEMWGTVFGWVPLWVAVLGALVAHRGEPASRSD